MLPKYKQHTLFDRMINLYSRSVGNFTVASKHNSPVNTNSSGAIRLIHCENLTDKLYSD